MANTTGVADHKATGPAIPGLTVERTKRSSCSSSNYSASRRPA